MSILPSRPFWSSVVPFTTTIYLPVFSTAPCFFNGLYEVFLEMDHGSRRGEARRGEAAYPHLTSPHSEIWLKQPGVPEAVLPCKTSPYSDSSGNACKQKSFPSCWRWAVLSEHPGWSGFSCGAVIVSITLWSCAECCCLFLREPRCVDNPLCSHGRLLLFPL